MEVQLNAQYPIYYPMEGRPFMVGSVQSGAAGAMAKLSHSFSNNPHKVYGIRISNTYDLPTNDGDAPTADQMALWQLCREIDDDQEVQLELSQISIFAQFVNQKQLVGARGIHWHPFACPYVIAGGNDFKLTVRRLTPYPEIGGQQILPYVSATLVCGMLASDEFPHEGPVRRRG
jgi:hypothetical protein